MLDHYRHQVPFILLSHGPLIRLCLRLLFMLVFAIFFLSLLQVVTESLSNILWNPFKERTARSLVDHHKREHSNLPPQEDDDEILNMDPKYPRTRDWLYDHIYFSFYDGTKVYTNQEYTGGTVSRKVHHEEQTMLSRVQERALKFLDNKYSKGRYSKEQCNSFKYRTIPTVGIEADVTCHNSKTGALDRLSLLIPLRPPKITYHHSFNPAPSINIIMPLQGKLESLKIFLTNLIDVLQENPIQVGLTVVYFEDKHVQEIRQAFQDADNKTPNLKTQFILLEGQQTFSRGRALQEGVERTTLHTEVMFFCDVDVLFTKDFLTRCQSTPVQGHQVFIPMLFSLYNPEFVYPLQKSKIPSPLKQLTAREDHGYWRVWGHGMVCLYKSDFHKIGGFDKGRTGWGGEDLAFVRKTVRTGHYKIIRSLDPGLFHLYHKKECNVSGRNYACLKVKAVSEASKQTLGFWYFKQKEQISVYGALVEGNLPYYQDDYDSDPKDKREVKADGVTQTQLISQYWELWEMLFALVLICVLVLDMFLMFQNYKYEQKVSHT